jgi:tRNA (mo5U34)-methyltransferase
METEWQSNLKWDRLVKEISPLKSRHVLDVGSGNGYYGFRMLEEGAEMVLGIDPHIAYVAQFWLLKHFAAESPVFVLPLTLKQVPTSLNYFDTVFSMGVIYHRRSPIDHILELKSCLRPGGELVIESICVDGEAGYSLTPEKKYARMGNVWFVPSIPTLVQWLSRCGMEQISVIDESTTTLDEQRKTEWMPFDSLVDALDVNNPQLTIEGLPAPKRVVVKAIRP